MKSQKNQSVAGELNWGVISSLGLLFIAFPAVFITIGFEIWLVVLIELTSFVLVVFGLYFARRQSRLEEEFFRRCVEQGKTEKGSTLRRELEAFRAEIDQVEETKPSNFTFWDPKEEKASPLLKHRKGASILKNMAMGATGQNSVEQKPKAKFELSANVLGNFKEPVMSSQPKKTINKLESMFKQSESLGRVEKTGEIDGKASTLTGIFGQSPTAAKKDAKDANIFSKFNNVGMEKIVEDQNVDLDAGTNGKSNGSAIEKTPSPIIAHKVFPGPSPFPGLSEKKEKPPSPPLCPPFDPAQPSTSVPEAPKPSPFGLPNLGPKTDIFTPKTDPFAAKTDLFAPKTDPVAPKTDLFAPKTDPFAPKIDLFAPKTDSSAPKTDLFAPKTDLFAPKAEPVAPKSDPAVPNSNPFSQPSQTSNPFTTQVSTTPIQPNLTFLTQKPASKEPEIEQKSEQNLPNKESPQVTEQPNAKKASVTVEQLELNCDMFDKLSARLKTANINSSHFINSKEELLSIFSKICLTVDEHFVTQCKSLYNLFKQHESDELLFLYLVREFLIKIFSDAKERIRSSKIVILYYAIVINALGQHFSHFQEAVISIVHRKFRIMIPSSVESTSTPFEKYAAYGFDKIPQTEKDSEEELVKKIDIEKYIDVIDAYSLVFFNVLGTDLSKYRTIFSKKGMTLPIRPFRADERYIDYYFKLKAFKEMNPAIPVILRNFVLSSSEIFPKYREKFLEIFKDIRDNRRAELDTYISGPLKNELKLFENKSNRDSLLSEVIVLKREVEDALKSGSVQDKFTKYDPQAR